MRRSLYPGRRLFVWLCLGTDVRKFDGAGTDACTSRRARDRLFVSLFEDAAAWLVVHPLGPSMTFKSKNLGVAFLPGAVALPLIRMLPRKCCGSPRCRVSLPASARGGDSLGLVVLDSLVGGLARAVTDQR